MSTGTSASDMKTALAGLAENAPRELLPEVLIATGIGDRYAKVAGPTGDLYMAWNADGISGVAPADDGASFEETFADRVGRRAVPSPELPPSLAEQVRRVVESGKLGTLDVDLSRLTPFQRAVLRATAAIPRGELRSYGWIAKEIGRPGTARAVGSTLNRNPVPVLIPCHRVGRSDGTVGEYAFGPAMKRTLLRHEGVDPDALDADAARGVRLVGSDTTHIFCLSTCRNARRVTDTHRVEFRSEAQATSSGFRACKVCRPGAAA